MSKNKTLRRLSSAALLSLAMYSQTMSPGWTKEVRAFESKGQVKIERNIEVKKKADEVFIGRGVVKSKSETALVVSSTKDKKDYTVTVDDKTKFTSRSFVKSSFSDINVGNIVSLTGKIDNNDPSFLRAISIRDLSLNLRTGLFKGTVDEVTPDGLKLKIRNGKILTVETGSPKITDRVSKQITLGDIKVGDTIRVKGSFNGANNTLTEVVSIKDLSLPLK